MQQKCCVCGKEEWEKYMHPYFTGRRTLWMCWDCYQESQRQATESDFFRMMKLHRIRDNKKARK